MSKFEHCRLVGNRIKYLGRTGLLDDKKDTPLSEKRAWNRMERDGWELVSAVTNQEGEIEFYFKRLSEENDDARPNMPRR
jgi:hypothetical protein